MRSKMDQLIFEVTVVVMAFGVIGAIALTSATNHDKIKFRELQTIRSFR
jgi:hypothetical protein